MSQIIFGQVLNNLRIEHHLTMKEMGALFQKSESAISRWISGKRFPTIEEIEQITKYFNVTVDYLLFGTKGATTAKIDPSFHLQTDETTTLDLFGSLSAGTGQYIYDYPIEQVEVPLAIIPDRDYDMMLRVVGDSMEPTFANGEYVFVKKTPNVRNGQFAAVIIDNEAYLKKIYIEDDHLRLVSLNKKYEDIIADGTVNIHLVGVIVL